MHITHTEWNIVAQVKCYYLLIGLKQPYDYFEAHCKEGYRVR